MRLDMLISVGDNQDVCVRADKAVRYVPCLHESKREGLSPGYRPNSFFVLYQSVLRTIAVGLHGPLGRKHRLTLSPVARRLDSQRGTRQHAFDQGGRQQRHGKNRWLIAALAGHQEVRPVGEGGLVPPLGGLFSKQLREYHPHNTRG